jgi:hypothetical protein
MENTITSLAAKWKSRLKTWGLQGIPKFVERKRRLRLMDTING